MSRGTEGWNEARRKQTVGRLYEEENGTQGACAHFYVTARKEQEEKVVEGRYEEEEEEGEWLEGGWGCFCLFESRVFIEN